MIVKVQVPLATNEKKPLALVYNEDRSIQFQMPVSAELLDKMEGRPKAFFRGVYNEEEQTFGLHEEAPWQDW